jgi:hypothetical protein
MKKICSLFFAVLLTLTISAQSPQSFNYQTIARDANGDVFSNTQLVIGIRIIQGSVNGVAVLTEEYSKTTNAFGLINLEIGSQNSAAFSAINWFNGPFFVEVSVNDILMGTSQLLSVPYSQYAEKAGNGLTADDAIKLESIAEGAEVNVNADWKATSGDAQILNKPTIPVADGSETKVTAGTNISVTGTGSAANPYIVNSSSGAGGFVHYIGELFGGGIVVAVWKVGGVEKGLIASLVDMKTSTNSYYMAWSGNTTTIIGLNAQSPINGQTNTNAIIAQSSIADKAATVCNIYSITDGTGTYNDWYLPAVWELNQCYNAAFIVNTILGSTNGFQFDYYWSSTETYDNFVGFQYFDYGSTYYDYKTSEYRVRAVRRF